MFKDMVYMLVWKLVVGDYYKVQSHWNKSQTNVNIILTKLVKN